MGAVPTTAGDGSAVIGLPSPKKADVVMQQDQARDAEGLTLFAKKSIRALSPSQALITVSPAAIAHDKKASHDLFPAKTVPWAQRNSAWVDAWCAAPLPGVA